MVRFSWLAVFALLASFMVIGCSADAETEGDSSGDAVTSDEGDTTTEPIGEVNGDEGATADDGMTLASSVYQKDGVAVCPISGDEIADIDTAPSREADGTTFYFC